MERVKVSSSDIIYIYVYIYIYIMNDRRNALFVHYDPMLLTYVFIKIRYNIMLTKFTVIIQFYRCVYYVWNIQ